MCFEGEKGINFEELIGVVYVVCFLMVFLLMLGEVGFMLISIDIIVDVSLDKVDVGFAIMKIVLKSEVVVSGIDVFIFDGII